MMSTSSRSDTDDSIFDADELLDIEARCRQLRREKDLLKSTQSQSFDLIRRLELHVRRLNEARLEDRMKIQELENKLNDSHQEIDYLEDQLNARNARVDDLEERVQSFEMKMMDFDLLEEEAISLREELMKSNSECDSLIQKLGIKDSQLQQSRLHIEKLEESIASTALDYQCEIESLRLEMMSLEQNCFDFKQSEVTHKQKARFEGFKDCGENLSHDLPDYEELVKELKEELRKEKLKAKEEAEDLAQEMAELRYQMTELLEEERKRRACIEQASLHRISELEAQLQVERRKTASVRPVQSICEA